MDKPAAIRFGGPSLLCLVLLLSRPAAAAWPTDPLVNLPVCTETRPQQYPVAISDGAGGAIFAWHDARTWQGYYGQNIAIYAQRVSAAGVPLWGPGGVAVCAASGSKGAPAIAPDGAGGAIVAWQDGRAFDPLSNCCDPADIYAQRITADGVALWTSDGVALCTAPRQQAYPVIVADGAGGAIVAWQDTRDSSYGYVAFDIYAQRISAGGAVQWAIDGVPVCTSAGDQQHPVIATDGADGAIVSWTDHRPGHYSSSPSDIYSQRVSAAGSPLWTPDGVAVCTATLSQLQQVTVEDGAGGAIVVWQDGRSGVFGDLYAQRLSADGTAQWAANGVVVCPSSGDKWNPTIAPDGAGGTLVAWWENRFGSYDIYAERISPAGSRLWNPAGVAVCSYYDDQRYPAVVCDGANGAIVAWQDRRNGANYDIYAQRISAAGAIGWTSGGVALCTAADQQSQPTIAPDGRSGAIVAWMDDRSLPASSTDIYAQAVLATGVLGGTVGVAGGAPPVFALHPVRPNPLRGGAFTVRFTLAGGAAASLELLDIAGRRVVARGVGSLGAGHHAVDIGEGRRLAPGLYLLRLREAGDTRVARVVVLR